MIEIILLIFGVGIIIILILASAPKVKHHYGKVREDFEKLDEKAKLTKKNSLHDSLKNSVKHYDTLAIGILASIEDLKDLNVDPSAFIENIGTLDEAIDEVEHYKKLLSDIGESVNLSVYITKRNEVRTALKKLILKRKDVEVVKKSTSYVVL